MPETSRRSVRTPPFLVVALLALAGAGCVVVPGHAVQVERASQAAGLETRHGPLRIGEDAAVEGPLLSRNGPITIGARSRTGRVSSRNGPVRVGPEADVGGAVESRNGWVELGDGAIVRGGIETRNGPITLGEGARVHGPVETRNGAVRLGTASRVYGDVETRNGSVRLAREARINGSVVSRNGGIRLEDAHVDRDVDVMEGDVELVGASEVQGDLILLMPEDRGGWSWWRSGGSERTPTVRIDADARVGGRLIVDERVDLEIAPGADVPEPERFPSREAWPER